MAPSRRAVPVAAAPADWGVFTPVVLLFSFFVLFLVGLMLLGLAAPIAAQAPKLEKKTHVYKTVDGLAIHADVYRSADAKPSTFPSARSRRSPFKRAARFAFAPGRPRASSGA